VADHYPPSAVDPEGGVWCRDPVSGPADCFTGAGSKAKPASTGWLGAVIRFSEARSGHLARTFDRRRRLASFLVETVAGKSPRYPLGPFSRPPWSDSDHIGERLGPGSTSAGENTPDHSRIGPRRAPPLVLAKPRSRSGGRAQKNAPAEPSSRPKPVYDSTGAEGKLSAAAGGWQPPERTNLRALVEVFAFRLWSLHKRRPGREENRLVGSSGSYHSLVLYRAAN
jgi:hypothetical protein